MEYRHLPQSLGRKRRARLSLALALGCGAMLTTFVVESPAAAQKRGGKERAAQNAATHSDAFRKAFQPASALYNATPRDPAAMRALVPSVTAAASTPDDRFLAGQYIYATGTAGKDAVMQLQGVTMMIESGRLPAAEVGKVNFAAGQLAYQAKDYARARQFLQAAIAAGYTEQDPNLLLADTYLQMNDAAGALTFLGQVVDRQVAAGQVPSRDYLRRGLATAVRGNLTEQAIRFGQLYARHYPGADSWGDALVVTRGNRALTDDDMLDLLRLQRKTKTFRDGREYLSFIEFADPRRLPNEVSAVIDEGYASGLLARSNAFATDARTTAQGRKAQVRNDLAGLERDANAANARLTTVVAAGNVAMDAGQPAKAEQFFRKASTMPGADKPLMLTRLGIAQVEQGKYADAVATFKQVQGPRAGVAQLWAIYAEQQQGGSARAG